MIRRRTLLGAALGASSALGLAACAGDENPGGGSAGSDTSDGGGSVLADVSVSDNIGEEPAIEFQPPLSVESADSTIVVAGDGDPIETGDTLYLTSAYVDGATGELVQSWWQGAPADVLTVDDAAIGPAAAAFFPTAKIGARIAMTGWQQDARGQMVSLVQVADIVGKSLRRAAGEQRELPADVPAAVTLADNGAPAVEGVTEIPTPDSTQAHVLIEGTGEETAAGDQLVMHYTGWQTSDGTEFDSSWGRGQPFSFALGQGQVIPGWDSQLAGIPVGSQLMLVIPPAEAYGEAAPSDAGAEMASPLTGQTLVFVVDVLGKAPVSPAAQSS